MHFLKLILQTDFHAILAVFVFSAVNLVNVTSEFISNSYMVTRLQHNIL